MIDPGLVRRPFSTRLEADLVGEIDRAGPLSFADFMQQALYHSENGYYHSGVEKIGRDGDFITAPEVSVLFAQAIANYTRSCVPQWREYPFLELGAGRGTLAAQLVELLNPQAYHILELSADLRSTQMRRLDGIGSTVQWLDELPDCGKYLIIANEVIDALPVNHYRFHQNRWFMRYIDSENGRLKTVWLVADDADETVPPEWPRHRDYYHIPILSRWLTSMAVVANNMLISDYGSTAAELARLCATGIRCFGRHRQYRDPLTQPGHLDISCDVNFSAIMDHPSWWVQHYCTQARLMIDFSLPDVSLQALGSAERLKTASAIKTLTMENEMGQIFKFCHLRAR